MDIQKIITDLVAKLKGNNDLIAKFTKDPAAAIKELLNIDVDAGQIAEIVKGVQSALGNVAGDTVKEGKSFLSKLKAFFGGK